MMPFNAALRRRMLAGLCMALAAAGAAAQSFPTKPVVIVSPYQPGDSADTIIRTIAEAASRNLGQPVLIEAKPGAEGMIGAMDVAKAPPDGYRVLWAGAGSLMISPTLRRNPPFDPVTSFTPIAASIDFSFFLYVNPSVPAKDVNEFVTYVKANPGKLTYATGNNLGLMSMSDIALKQGLDMVRVQYKGETGAATDLVSNRVQAMFATTSIIGFAKENKLRVLATSLSRRSPLLPDVPTLKEAGIRGVDFGGGWLGIYGPPGMARPVVERLNKAFSQAFADPDVQAKLLVGGLVYTPYTTQEQLEKFTKDQRDLYRSVVKAVGIPMVD